jgi:serine/threonine-protein kinase
MQSFLNYANPHWSGLGSRFARRSDFTVREALHDVVARMDTELADSPEVRADLHYTIGEVYSGSGDGESAAQHFRMSLELYRQVHGDEHPKVARGMYYGTIYEPNNEKAEQQLRQALLIMRRTDPENVNLPHMLQALGEAITKAERESRDASRLAEAEAMILEAQSIFRRTKGESHSTTISTYSSLAFVALARNELVRAESLREEALRRYQQAHHEHIWALFYVGEVKRKLGKDAEAETFFRQALDLARKRWSANDPRLEQLVSYVYETRAAARR